MMFQLFSMQDNTSGVFLQPFVARSESDAKRSLALGFEDPQFLQTPAGRYPHEFALYKIGAFDDETGVIAPCTPVRCAILSDLRPMPPASTVSP